MKPSHTIQRVTEEEEKTEEGTLEADEAEGSEGPEFQEEALEAEVVLDKEEGLEEATEAQDKTMNTIKEENLEWKNMSLSGTEKNSKKKKMKFLCLMQLILF